MERRCSGGRGGVSYTDPDTGVTKIFPATYLMGCCLSLGRCFLSRIACWRLRFLARWGQQKKPPLEGDLYVSARRPLRNAPKRQAISRLEPGTPTAHMWTCLLLLPSGPDKVHRDILRWTQLSSLLNGRQTLKLLPGGRHQSCYSGLQVTGHR